MNIVIISCCFPPDLVVSAKTSADLAFELIWKGNTVTVIAPFPSRNGGSPGYYNINKLFHVEKPNAGLTLVRGFSFISTSSTILSRFIENLSFGLLSALAILFIRRADIIYLNTWPILAQSFITVISIFRHIPLIVSIQDLYPESLLAQNRFKSDSKLYAILEYLDRWNASHWTSIVVIARRFKDSYMSKRGVSPDKIHVIPNWIDGKVLEENGDEVLIRNSYRIPADDFLLVYAGNIGKAADIETFIKSYSLVQNDHIWLLLAGEGSQLLPCQRLVKTLGLQRVIFHNPWKPTEIASVLLSADLLLLPTAQGQSQVSLPSKLMHYLASGKPILAWAQINTDLYDVMVESKAGWVIDPKNHQETASEIQRISTLSPDELFQIGANGRNFYLKQYSRENLLKIVDLIEMVGSGNL